MNQESEFTRKQQWLLDPSTDTREILKNCRVVAEFINGELVYLADDDVRFLLSEKN